MFYSKPKRPKMKPVLFSEVFLRKEGRPWDDPAFFDAGKTSDDHAFFHAEKTLLLKYFPKYYNCLYLSSISSRAIQCRIRKLKVVRNCSGWNMEGDYQKVFKKLLRSSRKTLSTIPDLSLDEGGCQDFSSCLYFPKVKTLDLTRHWEQEYCFRREYYPDMTRQRLRPKQMYAFYGHFWSGATSLESLDLAFIDDFHFQSVLFKKIDGSTRFLSHLKRMKLSIHVSKDTIVEMMKYKNLLRHVTHLKICYPEENIAWKRVQSVLNCCPQLYSLSFQTGYNRYLDKPYQDFCLDLSYLQNLQVLEAAVDHIRIFLNGIDFSSSLREMTLEIQDFHDLDDFSDIFETQQYGNRDRMVEEKDARDWTSFEKHKILSDFFEKCKKLSKLRVLHLTFDVYYQMDVFKLFILPFLRGIPQLETLNLSLTSKCHHRSREDKLFDLEVFFSEIGSLLPLKHLRIRSYQWDKWRFSGSSDLQQLRCLSNLSSIEIQGAQIFSAFDFKKFLHIFLDSNNAKQGARKSFKFHQLYISSSQDLIKILNLMHSVSHFKNLQIDLQIHLTVENIDDLYSNFPYPIYVAKNTKMKMEICLKHSQGSNQLTSEQKQYFKMIFGQFRFTVATTYHSGVFWSNTFPDDSD